MGWIWSLINRTDTDMTQIINKRLYSQRSVCGCPNCGGDVISTYLILSGTEAPKAIPYKCEDCDRSYLVYNGQIISEIIG